jgi:hypothetical protein
MIAFIALPSLAGDSLPDVHFALALLASIPNDCKRASRFDKASASTIGTPAADN